MQAAYEMSYLRQSIAAAFAHVALSSAQAFCQVWTDPWAAMQGAMEHQLAQELARRGSGLPQGADTRL